MFSIKTIKCPVCKKTVLPVALKNHVIGAARFESYKKMKDLLDRHPVDFKTVSRLVMIRQMPHLSFIRKHMKNSKKFEL